MNRALLTSLALVCVSSAFANFSYPDFSSLTDLQLNGTAVQTGNFIRLTQDEINDQAGNVWHTNLQTVGNGFSTTFQFRCDGVGTVPADGIAFGVQANGTSELGNAGGDNGMLGIAGSLIVNFQSFWEKAQIVATDSDGNITYFDEVTLTGLHRSDPWLARIDYDGSTQEWSVSLDGSFIIGATYDVTGVIGGMDAYMGIGAGTGLGYDNNDLLSWDAEVVPEPASLTVLGISLLGFLRRRQRRA